MAEKTDPKEDFFKALSDSDRVNERVQHRANRFVETSRLQLDLNAKLKKAAAAIDTTSLSTEMWGHMTSGLRAQTQRADIAWRQMEEVELFVTATGTSVASVSSSTASYFAGRSPAPLSHAAWSELQQSLHAVFRAGDVAGEVMQLVEELGLDSAHPGSRRPNDHFQVAMANLKRPSGPDTSPAAVLLELREGIDTLLDRCLTRIGGQKPGKTADKVARIGEKVGRLDFGRPFFDRLGFDLNRLRELCSQGKGAAMSREEVSDAFSETLYVVLQILRGIEPSRLR